MLRHTEGLSYAEIAEVLDVPDGTVKGRVGRGRAAMLVALTEEDPAIGGVKPPDSPEASTDTFRWREKG